MLIDILKIFFFISAATSSIYSINTFGPGFWSLLFIGISILVLLSVFIEKLNAFSVVIVRISGVLSTLAFLLLLLLAAVGGSFHLSKSNEIFAAMLFISSMFGLSAFFWPVKKT